MIAARTVSSFLVCWLIAGNVLATSYAYQPLKLPHSGDVVAFANGVDEIGERVIVPRKRVLEFLSQGKNNTDVGTWFNLENKDEAVHGIAQGVFTDKAGKVYFWTIRNPNVLKLISAEHEQALIQLGK